MRITRVFLVAVVLLAATVAEAAPAPVAKPARREPSPGTLLANLRAEGYQILALERGREPGTYEVTLPASLVFYSGDNDGSSGGTIYLSEFSPRPRVWTVRVTSADVRADLRAFLKARAVRGTFGD